MAPQILGKPIRSWKQSIIFFKTITKWNKKTEQWKFGASIKNMKKFGVSGKKKSLEYMEKLRTLCSL